MTTTLVRTGRRWLQTYRTLTIGEVLTIAAPSLVAAGLFKLAISEGGRHIQSLTLVQTGVFLVTAILLWTGRVLRAPLTWPLLAVVGAIAVTSTFSVRPDSSIRELLLWSTYTCIFVIISSTLRTPRASGIFLDAMVFIAGWVCLTGLWLFWGANDPGMRWYSTFYWPNPFAAFLLLVIPVEVSRLVDAHTVREAVAHGGMTVLLTVPFILTYSRGAWLSLLGVLAFCAILFRSRSRFAAAGRVGLVILASLATVIVLTRGAALRSSPQAVLGRAVSVANASDNSIQGRLNFWRSGLRIFRDRPLLGTGPGTFAYVHAAYQTDVRHYARDAHSLYIQTAAEMGTVGLVALVVLLAAVGSLCVRVLRQVQVTDEYPQVAGLTAGLAAFFLHSAMEMNWPFPANPAMAFALLGVLASYGVAHENLADDPAASPPAARWRMLAIVAIAAGVVAVQLLQASQIRLVQGKRHVDARRYGAAVGSLRAASRLNPVDPKAPSGLAVALERSGAERGQIVALIRRSIRLDRMNAYYPVQLAEYLYRTAPDNGTNRQEAVMLLKRALKLDPYHYPEAYGLLIRIHEDGGQVKQAEATFEEARARYGEGWTNDGVLRTMLWPGVARLYMDRARFLIRQGRLLEASRVYQEIIAEDAGYVPAYLEGTDLLLRRHRAKDAVALLRRGLDHAPASESLWRRWRQLSVGRSRIWEQ